MKISEIVNFEIKDNYVQIEKQKVYFLRFSPPNLNIMTQAEKDNEVKRFQEFYDSLMDQRFQTFSLDKTENLKGNRDYWSSLLKDDDNIDNDNCALIKNTIISKIDDIESTSSSVGRAFYFVLKVKDQVELSSFETCLNTKGINYYIAEKQELVTVLRNYILREFIGFDIYDFEREVEISYGNNGNVKKATGKRDHF